jgi:hypothetical protein
MLASGIQRTADGQHAGRAVDQRRPVPGLHVRRIDWLSILRDAGFEPRATPVNYSDVATEGLEVFVVHRPVAM